MERNARFVSVCTLSIMNEFLMIPKNELPQDVDYYKGELTGNAWLNEAAKLAAAKKRILQDNTIPPEETVRRIKPLGHKILRANKKNYVKSQFQEGVLEMKKMRTRKKMELI